ncbi:Flavone synthase [Acorus gramineus]|uniref:Flavone synthase n=1 Tax=Acorus gramineus TaxID=55184 RepID=A0AAV9BBU5_ACOGR|nr:Flavone synthase [Acorus gramineus]
MSLNYYPSCPRPELTIGLQGHSDASGFSILMQDCFGLQVLKDAPLKALVDNEHPAMYREFKFEENFEFFFSSLLTRKTGRALSSHSRNTPH